MIRQQILDRIEGYLGATGMAETTFGLCAVHDGKFLRRLRQGKVTLRNVERALLYIDTDGKSDNGAMRAFGRLGAGGPPIPPPPKSPAAKAVLHPGGRPPAALACGDPVERAALVLGGRFCCDRRGSLRLDGRPASLPLVVGAANEVLAARGHPLIAFPGVAEPAEIKRC